MHKWKPSKLKNKFIKCIRIINMHSVFQWMDEYTEFNAEIIFSFKTERYIQSLK